MKQFESMARRGIYYFLATYSEFCPIEHEEASLEDQRAAHEYIWNLYQQAYEEPKCLGLKDYPDDCYGDWQAQKEKQGLDTKIRKYICKLEQIMSAFCQACVKGTCTKRGIEGKEKMIDDIGSLKKLVKLGTEVKIENGCYLIIIPEKVAKGLRCLAKISVRYFEEAVYQNTSYLLFSRGVFDVEHGFVKKAFAKAAGNEAALNQLYEYLESHDYIRIENREFQNRFAKITLDFLKYHEEEHDRIREYWGEKTHTGVEVMYEEIRGNPFSIALRIPYFKMVLENHQKLDKLAHKFLMEQTKKCDNCRCCVLSDKTGKRPRAFFKIEGQPLCPLYPGFSYKFKHIDKELVDKIISMLESVNRLIDENKKEER